jgi:hypothetical protein
MLDSFRSRVWELGLAAIMGHRSKFAIPNANLERVARANLTHLLHD